MGNIFQIPAQHISDGYKLGHVGQYVDGTEYVTANMTPRSFKLANVIREYFNNKIVYVGIQPALQTLSEIWQSTFFSQPKEEVIAKYARRLKAYLGPDKGDLAIASMARLHDLGYLPLVVKSLPEGSRVNAGIPFYTITNTHPDFFWLTNYVETFLSCMIWPMCNAASISEQYWQTSKRFAEQTGAPEFWVLIANHCFAARGMRGYQDAAMSGAAHMLFSVGTDTLWSIDYLEHYYDVDATQYLTGISVNAFEHATATQRIAYFGGEAAAFRDTLTTLYPTGIVSYVSDSIDYYELLRIATTELKDVILNRQPDASGLVKTVFRPDSSLHTPKEIICGYDVCPTLIDNIDDFELTDEEGILVVDDFKVGIDLYDFECESYNVVGLTDGTGYWGWVERGESVGKRLYIDTSILLTPDMLKGTLHILAEGFGYTVNGEGFKVINPLVGLIYGEAISLTMQNEIYEQMIADKWCVSNVLFGVGSWAFLDRSSRDSYGIAIKGTNSIVKGRQVSMQKNPKTSAAFKKSARGLLRVELENGSYKLYDDQTPEQEQQGELKEIWRDEKFVVRTTLPEMRTRLGVM